MSHVVAKEFKTVDRKFAAGDPIAESDIHPEGLLSFGDWVKRGFVAADNPVAMTSAPVLASEDTHA